MTLSDDSLDFKDELDMKIEPEVGLMIEYYRDRIGEWRWNMLASNGRQIADSGEGYHNRSDMLEIVDKAFPGVPVTERGERPVGDSHP